MSHYSNKNRRKDRSRASTDNKLYKLFTEIVCDCVESGEYMPDSELEQTIETALVTSGLVGEYRARCSFSLTKEKNGAWGVQFHRILGKRSIYFGFKNEIPTDLYNEEGYQAMQRLIQDCPKLVRQLRAEQKRKRKQLSQNSSDEWDEKHEMSEIEKYGVCNVCHRAATVTRPFDRHICRVEAYFECSNFKCKGEWSTMRGFLDPETEQSPKDGESYCKICRWDGRMVDWVFNPDPENGGSGEHMRDLCGACRKWGDCRGVFVQVATVQTAFREVYKMELVVDRMEDESNGETYFQASFVDEEKTKHCFYIEPYVNIM